MTAYGGVPPTPTSLAQLAANVRKFGGSFIVIAQKSTDVIVAGDTGITDNTSMKFLFSVDGERDVFQRRLKLSDEEMARLESLTASKGEYSELMFQDVAGSRVMRVQLSRQEYWSMTSSQVDNQRLNELMIAVHGLTIDAAVRVLNG